MRSSLGYENFLGCWLNRAALLDEANDESWNLTGAERGSVEGYVKFRFSRENIGKCYGYRVVSSLGW